MQEHKVEDTVRLKGYGSARRPDGAIVSVARFEISFWNEGTAPQTIVLQFEDWPSVGEGSAAAWRAVADRFSKLSDRCTEAAEHG